ncbi:hypothetical protein [Streptomyces sp. NPDC057257]|uniref:hypothetical protein n=1 Tax=Streptomyces sp. NPDC057257 TaxID=3346071 RepID=UPI0036438D6C
MVRQLLGEPDLLRDNPYVRTGPQTRLYAVKRVEDAERSDEFRAASAAAARRSHAAQAAAQRRRREVLARVAAEPIDVPRIAPRRLARLAVEHRNRRDEERTAYAYERWDRVSDPATDESADPDPDSHPDSHPHPAALTRWKVDYLRHRLTRYHDLLDELFGRTGRAAAERLLRRRIYAAISEAYPDLAQECERRLLEPEHGPPPE